MMGNADPRGSVSYHSDAGSVRAYGKKRHRHCH